MEKEVERKLPFLDEPLIKKNPANNRFQTSIHHKQTYTGGYW